MRIYLETSAFNQIYHDPLRGRLLDAIAANHSVHLSTINIIEAAASSDASFRRELLQFMHLVGGDWKPLLLPYDALKASLTWFALQQSEMNWSIGDEMDVIWSYLNHPEQVDDEISKAMVQFKTDQEEKFRFMFGDARSSFQEMPQQDLDRLRSASEVLRAYDSSTEFLDAFFEQFIVHMGIGVVQTPPTGSRIIRERLEPWIFFFGAYACQIYQRNIRVNNFGHRGNAGNFDSQQAIYLACTDSFVTHDNAQFQAVRLISRCGTRRPRVQRYQEFRNFLLHE